MGFTCVSICNHLRLCWTKFRLTPCYKLQCFIIGINFPILGHQQVKMLGLLIIPVGSNIQSAASEKHFLKSHPIKRFFLVRRLFGMAAFLVFVPDSVTFLTSLPLLGNQDNFSYIIRHYTWSLGNTYRYLEVFPRSFCLLSEYIPISITSKALCCLDHYVNHGSDFSPKLWARMESLGSRLLKICHWRGCIHVGLFILKL